MDPRLREDDSKGGEDDSKGDSDGSNRGEDASKGDSDGSNRGEDDRKKGMTKKEAEVIQLMALERDLRTGPSRF